MPANPNIFLVKKLQNVFPIYSSPYDRVGTNYLREVETLKLLQIVEEYQNFVDKDFLNKFATNWIDHSGTPKVVEKLISLGINRNLYYSVSDPVENIPPLALCV